MARRTGLRAPKYVPDPEDFGPYFLEESDVYYQGPHRSTRVRAHQFVPLDPNALDSEGVLGSQFEYWKLRGYIYVRWWKKGNITKYGPCTLMDYRTFRENYSKGRYVRFLENFGYTAGSDSERGVDI